MLYYIQCIMYVIYILHGILSFCIESQNIPSWDICCICMLYVYLELYVYIMYVCCLSVCYIVYIQITLASQRCFAGCWHSLCPGSTFLSLLTVPALSGRQCKVKQLPEISLQTMLRFVYEDYRQLQLSKHPEQYKELQVEVKLPLLCMKMFSLLIQQIRERCLIK